MLVSVLHRTCRLFLLNPTETAFTKIGFRDWKHAKEKGKGFTYINK